MSSAILVTGHPGCGKTTLIRRVLAQVARPAGGFYTQEVRVDGRRQGFQMVTFDGQQGMLAHVDITGGPRVGRYGVDVAALDAVGVASVRRALDSGGLVVIDEIGPMEFFSAAFRQVVLDALEAGAPVFGSIVKRHTPFGDQIKARPGVALVEVTPANRDALVADLVARVAALGSDS